MSSAEEAPLKTMGELIHTGNAEELKSFVEKLPQLEMVRVISRLPPEDQKNLFSMLDQREATEIISSMPEPAALQVVEKLAPEQAGETGSRGVSLPGIGVEANGRHRQAIGRTGGAS